MDEINIANMRYRIVAIQRDGQWLAHAERIDNGDRFGVECAGPSEADAKRRMQQWLEWQSEHTRALETLQPPSARIIEPSPAARSPARQKDRRD